jgi:hypothetical protein
MNSLIMVRSGDSSSLRALRTSTTEIYLLKKVQEVTKVAKGFLWFKTVFPTKTQVVEWPAYPGTGLKRIARTAGK